MNKLSLLFLTLILTSCAAKNVHKDWVATGGSRADATVKLSYQYSRSEIPTVSEQQGLEVAKKRCASWGYADAEEFGGTVTQCVTTRVNPWTGVSECNDTLITKQYQCLGQGNETPSKK